MTEDRNLARIRKLLATAEHPNTPPAEAESAAQLAERLIAKYVIDRALIETSGDTKITPTTRRVAIDNPYVMAKCTLLTMVGRAHNVETIVHQGSGTATMVGFASDLDVVELLYTSLLMQAATAMLREPASDRRFRRAFLLGYAVTVGDRLAAARRDAEQSSAPGTALVLRDRSQDVADAARDAFPRARHATVSHTSRAGSSAGVRAGANADLGARRVGSTRTALSA